jgi:hypothetical protein
VTVLNLPVRKDQKERKNSDRAVPIAIGIADKKQD